MAFKLKRRSFLQLASGAVASAVPFTRTVAAGTDAATIGQYLQPTRRNLPVKEYVTPEQFERYRETGMALGFRMVFSGPLVRSSYMADLVSEQAQAGRP